MARSVLVIGYGNDLRGDDAAGPMVAGAVASRRWRGVRAMTVRQLTPEYAAPVAAAKSVVFVDAYPAKPYSRTRWISLAANQHNPVQRSPVMGHSFHPGRLLDMALTCYGRRPEAWLIAIPGRSFELGKTLSPAAKRGVKTALRMIEQRLDLVRRKTARFPTR